MFRQAQHEDLGYARHQNLIASLSHDDLIPSLSKENLIPSLSKDEAAGSRRAALP